MNVIALKLITGEDVIGEYVVETEQILTLKNTVGISVVRDKTTGQPNVGFSPFPLHSEAKTDPEISFKHEHIVYHYTPATEYCQNYESIFGAGLIVPNSKIITG